MVYEKETERIIGCAYEVFNVLGTGFLEQVYKTSLAFELNKKGIAVETEKHLTVFYKNVQVGFYVADLVVQEKIIVETKVVSAINACHLAQTKNYLRATGLTVGLVINFSAHGVQVKRVFV